MNQFLDGINELGTPRALSVEGVCEANKKELEEALALLKQYRLKLFNFPRKAKTHKNIDFVI